MARRPLSNQCSTEAVRWLCRAVKQAGVCGLGLAPVKAVEYKHRGTTPLSQAGPPPRAERRPRGTAKRPARGRGHGRTRLPATASPGLGRGRARRRQPSHSQQQAEQAAPPGQPPPPPDPAVLTIDQSSCAPHALHTLCQPPPQQPQAAVRARRCRKLGAWGPSPVPPEETALQRPASGAAAENRPAPTCRLEAGLFIRPHQGESERHPLPAAQGGMRGGLGLGCSRGEAAWLRHTSRPSP